MGDFKGVMADGTSDLLKVTLTLNPNPKPKP